MVILFLTITLTLYNQIHRSHQCLVTDGTSKLSLSPHNTYYLPNLSTWHYVKRGLQITMPLAITPLPLNFTLAKFWTQDHIEYDMFVCDVVR